MGELVALDLPPGPGFVDALRAAWDSGDAVLPVDTRLPAPAVARLLDTLRPSIVVSTDGVRTLRGGVPTEEGDALVVATSGTTGVPKGVVHTLASVSASAIMTSAALGVDPGRDRWVACLPLAHIGGLSVVTRSLLTGTPCTVLPGFDAAAVEDEARRGATLVSLVATTLLRCDASGYRAVLLGGAAPPTALPANVVTTYGMTETGSGCVYDGLPLAGVEVRIGGSDPRTADGWLPTGDGGRLGGDGTLTVLGRMAEVIVTGAEKVWPVPVEAVLAGHPDIAEVAVWKRPDPDWGERVVAWVVLVPGAQRPGAAELRELVADRIAPWAGPREVVVVDVLPRTASGKVRRADLS
jgi:O-succinylbenzoic acid--CoA ligase